MFKKITKKNNKTDLENITLTDSKEEHVESNINLIKQTIDNKQKKSSQGIQIKPLVCEAIKEDTYSIPKEDQNEYNIKKVFIPEVIIKERANDFLGIKREREEKMKEEKRLGLIQLQKELYSLPEELKPQASNQDDYVENLLKLSTAGIIDVPFPLEKKIKGEIKNIEDKVEKEVHCLKESKKTGNSNVSSKGNKGEMSHKQMYKLNNLFENVFFNKHGRKMKFLKEKMRAENKAVEDM